MEEICKFFTPGLNRSSKSRPFLSYLAPTIKLSLTSILLLMAAAVVVVATAYFAKTSISLCRKSLELKPSCYNVSLHHSMFIFLVSLFAFSIISAILYYLEQPAAAQATSTQESFTPVDNRFMGWHIEVPSNWIGPGFLNPEQSIVYWISDHEKIPVTISMYWSGGYSLDQFANEKVRLASSYGLAFLVSHQGYFGNIPGYQLAFTNTTTNTVYYTNILVVNNGLVYDIGLYSDAASVPTLTKVRNSIQIYNLQTTQGLDIPANNVGLEGLNASDEEREDHMQTCDAWCIDEKERMRSEDHPIRPPEPSEDHPIRPPEPSED